MRIRTAAGAVAASCVGAGAAAMAAGRYASRFALSPHPRTTPGAALLTVHAIESGRVTLTRTPDSELPGVYGLTGEDAHLIVGGVLGGTPDTVTRRLHRVSRGAPLPGSRLWLTPVVHSGDPYRAVGLEYAEDPVEGELGYLPAWFVPGDRQTWVIAVHGFGAGREQPLAVVPVLHDLGFPVLATSYRNDPGAPPSPDRIAHLGDTEWRDVDAAVRHCVRYGAERLVLYGWSTGAAMALRVADHSRLRHVVSGLILDSPVLDWQTVVRSVAREHGMPAGLLPLATRAAAGRTGLHAARLAGSADPDRLQVPMLLAHGPDDTVAPWRASREYAARRPELVTLHTVEQAGHQAMWNADPAGYEAALRRFLTAMM